MYNSKQIVPLRYKFLGLKMYRASRALELAIDLHKDLRKDGITPYYLHPIAVTSYLSTLMPSFQFKEETLVAALLHDVVEDTDVTLEDLRGLLKAGIKTKSRFSMEDTIQAISILSKNLQPKPKYWQQIFDNPIASLVKPADRINNIQSMQGCFTLKGQLHYMNEAEEYILPGMKAARRYFPEQEICYENMKLVLQSQIALIRHIHADEVMGGTNP